VFYNNLRPDIGVNQGIGPIYFGCEVRLEAV